ncbi:MAG: nucleotidyltransferase family protein, partial [Synergistaceae bacterium]|nr:nucleotidyltransferase family protein [Synergistaceae bacterium]
MLTGIIAEFNPLHLGHESLMRFAKSLPNSEGVIVILSSNFTQRGSASIVDKFSRASMAVMAGADLVIELPFLYACSAGQDFSRGSVEILGRLGCVSRIAFGMENPEFDAASLADVMAREPKGYREILRREIGRGASFPKAVSIALEEIFAGS